VSTMAGEYAVLLSLALSLLTHWTLARWRSLPDGPTVRRHWLSSCSPRTSCPGSSRSRRWLSSVVFEAARARGIEIRQRDHERGDYGATTPIRPGAVCCRSRLSAVARTFSYGLSVTPTSLGYSNDPVNTLHDNFTTLGGSARRWARRGSLGHHSRRRRRRGVRAFETDLAWCSRRSSLCRCSPSSTSPRA